ncbi:WYL domain-containing protein, partial [Erysipelatoclostridium ramosum]|nr:WYL domain-containing protein [Thomasclavelia ramosa]
MDLKLHKRRERPYIVNPYEMMVSNGHYYLIGNYDAYDNISHYRMDKIRNVVILKEIRKPITQIPECR